jgi:hypothetical protein
MSTSTLSFAPVAGASILGRLWQGLHAPFGGVKPAGCPATEEAAEVRAYAWRMQRTDPSFASDLLAAADRHERAAGCDN